MNTRLSLAFLLFLLTPSCLLSQSKVNEPLDAERMAQLVPGESDADDVLAVLGAPSDVVQLGKRSAWRYDRSRSKGTGLLLIVFNMHMSDSKEDRIWAFFDEADRLTHIGGTFEADDVEYGLTY
jgi:hypothetical protein